MMMAHAGPIAQAGVSSLLTLPTTGLLAAYDARSFVSVDGGVTASTWTDVSGFGWHGTQATAANRAAISTADGYPSLLFDGTNDNYSISLTAAAGPRMVYGVIKPTTLRGLFDTQTGRAYVGATGDVYRTYDTALRNTGVAVTTTRQMVEYQISSSVLSVWRNGTLISSIACAADAAIGGAVRLGSDYSNAAVTNGHILMLSIYGATRNTAVRSYYTQETGV